MRDALRAVPDLLLPPACLACGGWMGPRGPERRYLCTGCATRVRAPGRPACVRCGAPLERAATDPDASRSCRECHDWPPALVASRSAVVLRPPADALVHALKYGGWPEAATEMARAMTAPLAELRGHELKAGGNVLLVPVPTTRTRERRRGYNQARQLAVALSGEGQGEVVDLIVREGEAGSQVALHREARIANVSGAFRVVAEVLEEVRRRLDDGDLLVLVDDVLTTGATASAAATTLAEAGIGATRLLSYGRALPGRQDGDDTVLPPPGFFKRWLRTGRTAGA
jgi:predicted amidophosphoribosyltransferase